MSAPATPRVTSLSPSRAGDFKSCPLLYRFRSIDHLPEPPSRDAIRGTLVHAVLERLFDLPRAERTERAARELLEPCWAAVVAERPEAADLFADGEDRAAWLESAAEMLAGYFALEDPTRLEPAAREEYGVVRRVLRLMYLRDGDFLDYRADADELVRFERTLVALAEAIARSTAAQDFRPNPGPLCQWCAHQALCPAYGGTPPPFPEQVTLD